MLIIYEGDVELSDAAIEKAIDDLSASGSQFASKLSYSWAVVFVYLKISSRSNQNYGLYAQWKKMFVYVHKRGFQKVSSHIFFLTNYWTKKIGKNTGRFVTKFSIFPRNPLANLNITYIVCTFCKPVWQYSVSKFWKYFPTAALISSVVANLVPAN